MYYQNKTAAIIIALTLFCAAFSSQAQAAVRSNNISIDTYYQQQTRWCSVAAAQMLIHFIRPSYSSLTQSDIFFQETGYIKNEGGDLSVGDFMGNFGVVADFKKGVISFNSIMSHIDAGRPVQADIKWSCSGCGSHSVIITGYRQVTNSRGVFNYLTIWNPYSGWFPEDNVRYNYETFVENEDFYWRITRTNARLK